MAPMTRSRSQHHPSAAVGGEQKEEQRTEAAVVVPVTPFSSEEQTDPAVASHKTEPTTTPTVVMPKPSFKHDAIVHNYDSPQDKKSMKMLTNKKGLDSMKDLDDALDNIISNLPKQKLGTSSSRVYTRISQKTATTVEPEENVSIPRELSREMKEEKLQDITPLALNLNHHVNISGVKAAVILCKFVQCVLWDAGFRYTLLSYQFDAILASAGIDVKGLLDVLAKWSPKRQSLLVAQDRNGEEARIALCRDVVSFVGTRGLLLADGMGLGKTIEAIGAAILRNFICYYQEEEKNLPSLPTIIVVPSDAFVNQWKNALLCSGISAQNIRLFVRDNGDSQLQGTDMFILMSKYSLMTEMRHVLKGRGSILFPNLPEDLVNILLDTKMHGGHVEEITAALGTHSKTHCKKLFQTLIIDECHTLRNLLTYGGIGAALLGMASGRTVPVTCTPFINSTGDLATLMVFIDPTMPAAHKQWWKEATKQDQAKCTIDAVSSWKKYYVIRRDQEVLRDHLPNKTESVVSVQCFESELRVYQRYEQSFISTFEGFVNSSDPDLTLGKKDLTDILLLYLINMRMSLIHPLIPKGREFTIRFSPSRRHLEAQLCQNLCVCCSSDSSKNLVPLSSNFCHTTNSLSRHFVHEDCLNILEREAIVKCPRCKDLEIRSCVDSSVPYNVHCKAVHVAPKMSGFKSTAKIEKILEWVRSIPSGSKGIIFSFFEGALDLLEGVLTEDMGLNCARHDNDLSAEIQAIDLTRFKTAPECKILLATVQSCGSGLNIEEANYIAFVDRWFDITIHQQAISRCHNINQTKEVHVSYFDAAITVDEIMRTINESKSEHASITLADGTVIGAQQRSIRYQDVSGPIYDMIKSIAKDRTEFVTSNPGSPLISLTESAVSKSTKYGSLDDKESLCNSNVSPPSILKTQSLGSSSKSSNGGKERRVVFAPLPSDFANVPSSGANIVIPLPIQHPPLQQAQGMSVNSPFSNFPTNGLPYLSSPFNYSPGQSFSTGLPPPHYNYGFQRYMNPFATHGYFMQQGGSRIQDGYCPRPQPIQSDPFRGQETNRIPFPNTYSENLNPITHGYFDASKFGAMQTKIERNKQPLGNQQNIGDRK